LTFSTTTKGSAASVGLSAMLRDAASRVSGANQRLIGASGGKDETVAIDPSAVTPGCLAALRQAAAPPQLLWPTTTTAVIDKENVGIDTQRQKD